jgi:hypothetical protein
VLTGADAATASGILETQWPVWRSYFDAMHRLTDYLKRHAPDDWAALAAREEFPAEDDGWLEDCLAAYRRNYDPAVIEAEIATVEAEHDELMGRWADLPTPRAKEKAKERFAALEARIDELRQQMTDAAAVVEARGREVDDLMSAIHTALEAMSGDASSLRHRAEALRGAIQRIECKFTATGKTGSGWGNKNSLLAEVTFYPVVGDPTSFPAGSKSTVLYSRAHSCMYRTHVGRMR